MGKRVTSEQSRMISEAYGLAAEAGDQLQRQGGLVPEIRGKFERAIALLHEADAVHPLHQRLSTGRAAGIVSLCAYLTHYPDQWWQ